MIRNKDKFIFFTTIKGGEVMFGDNAKGKVVGKGKLLVEGLKHNLLTKS